MLLWFLLADVNIKKYGNMEIILKTYSRTWSHPKIFFQGRTQKKLINHDKSLRLDRARHPQITHQMLFKGSLEVKLPTIWTDEKQRWSRRIEKGREEERISKKRKSQKKEDPGARKSRKGAKQCVFPLICGSGGSKSRLAKAAGAEPAGQMRDEELHAVVARSTFPSQNVQNTSAPEHF